MGKDSVMRNLALINVLWDGGSLTVARSADSVIPAAVPFESGLTGKNTVLPEFLTFTPEEIAEYQRDTTNDLN